MTKAKVLISGAGIAGTVLAYWLGKNDFDVVILERSSDGATQGQIIDIAGPAQEICERMGVLSAIRSRVTNEAGYRLVDPSGTIIGTIPAGGSTITNEIEIMRPALAEVLCDAARSQGNVDIRFNTMIESLRQTESKVHVEIKSTETESVTSEEFDILVACDGLRSRTRNMILSPKDREGCIRSVRGFCAFFSIPIEPQDQPYARFCNFPGRRGIFLKPQTEKLTSVYFTCMKYHQSLHDARESRDVEKQKAAIRDLYSDLGWERERCVREMMTTDNFYFEEISQVYLNKWSQGRCVLVGDTAYCPSPLTGQGSNLAILGSYILAAKIVESVNKQEEPRKAFEAYEMDFRPYVNKTQPIPLGGYVPQLINPDSNWGIWILRKIFGWITWLQVWEYLPDSKKEAYPLPDLR